MARRGKNSENLFGDIRAMVPENIWDDTKLHEIIKLNNYDREKISLAVQNKLDNTPERLLKDNEWVTLDNSKTKKVGQKENEKPTSHHVENNSRGRGRGRGESQGGRGSGERSSSNMNENKGRGGGRNNNSSHKAYKSSKSESKPVESTSWDAPQKVVQTQNGWDYSEPSGFDAPSAHSVPSGVIAWKSGGMNLAEKLKKQDAEKLKLKAEQELLRAAEAENFQNFPNYFLKSEEDALPDIDVAEEVEESTHNSDLVASVADLTLNQEISYESTTTDYHVLETNVDDEHDLLPPTPTLIPEPSPVNASPVTATAPVSQLQSASNVSSSEEDITSGYLKLGRWETPQQSTLLQFGSFGKDPADDVSQPSTSSWAPSTIEVDTRADSAQESWGSSAPTNSSSNAALTSSLFTQATTKSAIGSVPSLPSSDQIKFDQKPPGLGEPSKLSSSVSSNHVSAQPRVSKPTDPTGQQSLSQVYPSYAAPPGIPTNNNVGNNSSGRGVNNVAVAGTIPSNVPYYAPSGYDAQYAGPYQTYPPVATLLPSSMSTPPAINVGGATSSIPSSTSTSTQQQQQQPLQQQQPFQYQYFQPPFYNQYYYQNPQMQGYYNQRGGMYQPRPNFGPDPYGNGQVFDMYGQPQPFPDASYGSIPTATTVGQTVATSAGAKNQKNTTTSNVAQGVSNPQGGMVMPDINSGGYNMPGYGMANPYNPRSDLQGWSYQQTAGWGAPAMMGYATSPSQQGPIGQGFGQPPGVMQGQPQQALPQQALPQQQSQQGHSQGVNNQRLASQANGSYGNGSFGGGRPSGSSPSTSGQPNW